LLRLTNYVNIDRKKSI